MIKNQNTMNGHSESGSSFALMMQRIHPVPRMLIAVGFAAVIYFMLGHSGQSQLVITLSAWCVFAIVYLTISWMIIFSRSITNIKRIARVDDGSALFVAFSILLASFAGLISVMLLVIDKDLQRQQTVAVPISVLAIFLAWVMVHTTFTFHYAHEYYDDDPKGILPDKGGLQFPGNEPPDYLDFAYFSFVIGMTFQVSDVEISSKELRKLALVHGLIAFALNTFVVALTINLIAGLHR